MDLTHYQGIDNSDQHYGSDSQKIVKSKNPRRRKREFYNTIRKQMEFYFGDANLSKDRFLMQLIKINPFIPLDIFLKFNKIKKLSASVDEIAKAISFSKVLKLSDDGTKVQRITDIPKNWNADDRTIYVECLPPTADHDWVKNVFASYGNVSYVSLPKFKISRKIKEFAFVEFEKPESVEKVLAVFREHGKVISIEDNEPEQLMSISSYIKEQDEIHITEKLISQKPHQSPDNNDVKCPNPKRRKLSPSFHQTAAEEIEVDQENIKEKCILEMPYEYDERAETIEKKKRRRRHKKSPKKACSLAVDASELKILSKIDWKKLRNKYLNMQRKKMSEIKRMHLRKKQNRSIKPTKMEVVKQTHSMNFYGAGQVNKETSGNVRDIVNDRSPGSNTVTDTSERNVALERKPLFTYEPDVIVHVKFPEPIINVKSFKTDIKQYPGVKYVDVKEGLVEAFVRCESPKYAKNLKKKISCAQYICEILSGDTEMEYWKKIMHDRKVKLNKEVKVAQRRGREKLSKAVASHIYFDDE